MAESKEVLRKRERLGKCLKKLLQASPAEGIPLTNIWNDVVSHYGKIPAKKELGVAKLSLVLPFYTFLEVVRKGNPERGYVRLKQSEKSESSVEKTEPDKHSSRREKEKKHQPKQTTEALASSEPEKKTPKSTGLLGGELLGPAVWQPPKGQAQPVAASQHAQGSVAPKQVQHSSERETEQELQPAQTVGTPTSCDPHQNSPKSMGPLGGLLGPAVWPVPTGPGSVGPPCSEPYLVPMLHANMPVHVLGPTKDWPTLQHGATNQSSRSRQFYSQHYYGNQNLPHEGLQSRRSTSRESLDRINHSRHRENRQPHQRAELARHSIEQVNSYAQICIDQLSEAGEYVSVERIQALLLQRLGRASFWELQLPRMRSVDGLDAVREHQRLACKVNASIQAFVQVRSICTLSELEQTLSDFAADKQSFESLKIGPLTKLPLIYELFKFPTTDVAVPKITTMDILQDIREFLTSHNKWTEKLEMEETMDHLVKKYDVPDAYHLGVRIRSLPLAVQMLKKAQRDAGSCRKTVLENMKDEVQREIEGAVQRFRASILQTVSTPEGDGCLEIKKHYLETAPELVVMEIFSKFQLLISIENPTNKRERRFYERLKNAITEFLLTIQKEPMAAKLFHLSVCVGAVELQEMIQELMAPGRENSEMAAESGTVTQQIKSPPPIDKMIEKLQSYLDRCLVQGTVTLENLQKIEELLLRDFEFPSFQSMGLCSFLWFILNQGEARKLLEQNCGITLGSASTHSNVSFYQPRYTDVLQVIRQAEGCGITQSVQLEEALCTQFCIKDVRNLGYGMIDRLRKAATKSGRHHTRDNCVFYEATLCQNNRHFLGNEQVGLLGHQTKESARVCLHNCPQLEDLEKWSNWGLVFQPELGPLKEFVQKYGGSKQFQVEGDETFVTTDFIAMETQPGQLIKLITNTSVEDFERAVQRGDAHGTCGHLLSQIVANKGVAKTSLALLANHVKSALFTMNANTMNHTTPGGPPPTTLSENKAVKFVLDCLNHLPIRICCSVASQIFLTPLGEVIGSRTSKIELLKYAENNCNYQCRLLELGCFLGFREWTEPFSKKLVISAEAVTIATEIKEDDEADEMAIELGEDVDEELAASDPLEESSSDESSSESDTKEDDMEAPQGNITQDKKGDSEEKSDSGIIHISSSLEEESSSGETTSGTDSENSKVDKCKQLIEQIRKEEFGIGLELSEDGQKLMKVQQERLGRSLDRLSKDLYSKDTHFVLELVQNADDNAYPSDADWSNGQCPAVEFVVETDKIIVSNNECGFEMQNIRALCDVGRSTKGKHKFGYIGQKGIGFKSVFRVTDSPEVHSNGYHIMFDVNSGPTGYILPHWLENCFHADTQWMTQIILPFKKEAQSGTLAARFNDIHPSLLLFLHRLRQLSVINKLENRVISMRRRDLDNNVVEIQHSHSTDLWLVVRKMLDASHISLQAKSGVEVESTEIALAFPLRPAGQTSLSQVLPPKQEVFAFLPLHSYGFRFIIQGDFDVPSSREDVDKDSAWNQWLRNEIPTLFIEALDAFKGHKDFNLMEAICSYLQMVPTEDEILDFFQPVATHILQKLRGKNCIPTHPNSKGEVFMKKPSQLITTRDSLVKEVVNPDILQKHLNLYYLHGDLAAMLNPSLTLTLGIETVTTQHLLQVGKAIALGLQSGGDADYLSNIKMVSRWFACVYRSMDDLHDSAEVLSSLKSMKMIPLSGGGFVSLDTTTVFLPVADTTPAKPDKLAAGLFLALQSDLFAVHPCLLDTPDNVINSQVRSLLQQMGVKSLSPGEVIGHHIIPVLKSDLWQEKSRELLVCYVVYIKQELDRNPNIANMDELRQVIRIVTSHGLRDLHSDPVHFPPQFGNKISLSEALPGFDWVYLDTVYLQFADRPSDVQRWRDFFGKLGVVDFLAIEKKKVHLTADNIEASPWSAYKDIWRPLPGGYVVEDYCCEEFRKLVTENRHEDSRTRQMANLCRMLDKEWDIRYSRFQNVSVCDQSGESQFDTQSSFSIQLRSLPWFPGVLSRPIVDDKTFVKMEESVTTWQPSLLYRNAPEIKALLGHTVPYAAVDMAPNSPFSAFLQIRTSVDTKTVQDLLISWSKRDQKDPAIFCTSLDHIKTVYQFLFDRLSPKDLQDLFHNHAIIFVPLIDSVPHQQISAGFMLMRQEVWWSDPSLLFTRKQKSLEEFHADISCKRTIQSIYHGMEDLFTGRYGRIQLTPTMTEYAQLWIHIANTEILSTDSHTLKDTLCLMMRIGVSLARNVTANDTDQMLLDGEKKSLLNLIGNQKVFPTKQNLWVSLSQHPMIADNRQYEQLFEEDKTVHILRLEAPRPPREKRRGRGHSDDTGNENIKPLLSLCGIATLTESVDRMDVTEMSEPCPVLMMYMHKVVPYLQQYLYTHYPEVYHSLITASMAARLQTMSFMQVATLEVVYSLKHSPQTVVRKKEACTYDHESNTFFFHIQHISKYPDINREIAKCFSENDAQCMKELRGFLAELTSIYQTLGDVSELLERHELLAVPDEEVPWCVPKPVIHNPPPPIKEEVKEPVTRDQPGDSDNQLRAWPPKSGLPSHDHTGNPKTASTERPASNVWPPPKPPTYMDTRELPPRFQNLPPLEGTEHVAEHTKPDERTTTEVHVPAKVREGDGEGRERRNVDTHVPSASGATTRQSQGQGHGGGEGKYREASTDGQVSGNRAIPQRSGTEGEQRSVENFKQPESAQPAEGVQTQQRETTPATPASGSRPTDASPNRDGMGRKRPPDDIATPSPKKPSLQLEAPVWNDLTMSEATFEELATGHSLELPEGRELDEGSGVKEIGDWGELLVRNYLVQLQAHDLTMKYVSWSKETGNEGNPYDFEIIYQMPDGQKSVFIEVKTTLSMDRGTFEISAQELKFALDRKDSYHIYRIYGAGSKDNVRLVRITNVAWQFDKKNLRLFMVV